MSVSIQDLRSIFLFAKFEESEIELVRKLITARDYSAGTIIFSQGEPSPGLWFVRRGKVRLYRVAPSGRELTLCIARLDSLPCMGACPLFDGDKCPANAQALDDATVYFIDRDRALAMAGDHKGMAHLFARVLANHSRYLMRLSSGLALRCSTPRLIDLLLTYADERGYSTPRGIELELDVSQQLLASVLGATPQMVAQDFLKLERVGVVDAQGKHIVILSVERLKAMI
ncbi:CRP-like cAMP-activated global transcriptional regulator [Anaerolineae bacterium]|nr:CRP-like cAMP-activated global transcriptional regulator [Anaerolineae bacterium]